MQEKLSKELKDLHTEITKSENNLEKLLPKYNARLQEEQKIQEEYQDIWYCSLIQSYERWEAN